MQVAKKASWKQLKRTLQQLVIFQDSPVLDTSVPTGIKKTVSRLDHWPAYHDPFLCVHVHSFLIYVSSCVLFGFGLHVLWYYFFCVFIGAFQFRMCVGVGFRFSLRWLWLFLCCVIACYVHVSLRLFGFDLFSTQLRRGWQCLLRLPPNTISIQKGVHVGIWRHGCLARHHRHETQHGSSEASTSSLRLASGAGQVFWRHGVGNARGSAAVPSSC